MFDLGFPPYWSTLKKLIWLVGSGVAGGTGWRTLTGSIVSFIASKAKAINSISVQLEPIQEGSGDPSPDNVRPITGWTGAKVTRTGKNRCAPYSDTSFWVVNGYLNSSGGVTAGSSNYRTSIYIKVEPSKNLVLTTSTNLKWLGAFCYDANKTPIANTLRDNNNGKVLISVSSSTEYIRIYAQEGSEELQLELGSTSSPYEAYNGTTLSVTFPDTVFGGEYEFVGGNGESTLASVDMGLQDWAWAYFSVSGVFRTTNAPAKNMNLLCSSYAVEGNYVPWGDMLDFHIQAGPTDVVVKDSRYTDVPTFKASLSGVQLVYELATPVAISLTGQSISTLEGQNNIWSDSGDVSITIPSNIIVEGT